MVFGAARVVLHRRVSHVLLNGNMILHWSSQIRLAAARIPLRHHLLVRVHILICMLSEPLRVEGLLLLHQIDLIVLLLGGVILQVLQRRCVLNHATHRGRLDPVLL